MARDGSDKGLGRIADEGWRPERAVQPSEGIPKGGTCVLAVCTTLGHLNYFVTLALQQHGQQSALRKGRDQFSHDEVFLFFLSEDSVIYRVGERALGVFSERLTVSCYANLRLGREPTNRRKKFPHVANLNWQEASKWTKDGSLVVTIDTMIDGGDDGSITATRTVVPGFDRSGKARILKSTIKFETETQ